MSSALWWDTGFMNKEGNATLAFVSVSFGIDKGSLMPAQNPVEHTLNAPANF